MMLKPGEKGMKYYIPSNCRSGTWECMCGVCYPFGVSKEVRENLALDLIANPKKWRIELRKNL